MGKYFTFGFWCLVAIIGILITMKTQPTPAAIQEQRRGLAEQRLYFFKDDFGRCYAAMDNPTYYGYMITTFTLVPCDESEKEKR